MDALAQVLGGVLPDYEIPNDDLIGEVLVPAMRCADEVRIGTGYFSSRCLAQIAPGLAAFLTGGTGSVRLLISPDISEEDRSAIARGVRTPEQVISAFTEKLLLDAELSDSLLVSHTLDCLAYLLAKGRLELRFVLMRAGMYHKKKWLFRQGDVWAAVHGSGNATSRGLLVNGEQMTVDRPWMDGVSASRRVDRLAMQWQRQWDNQHEASLTLAPEQGLGLLVNRQSRRVPTMEDFWAAWRRDHEAGLEPPLPPNVALPPRAPHVLERPAGLEWRTGRYAHQGRAVDEFLRHDGRGVLAIATGGGKTLAAFLAAVELQDRHDGPMLICVVVPTTPLRRQWTEEARRFGVDPLVPSTLSAPHRASAYHELQAALATTVRRTEVVVLTTKLFSADPGMQGLLQRLPDNVEVVFIGDEMHNLGAERQRRALPQRANRRLGLSATPVRQYDPDGTDALFDYFGSQIFEFGLDEAIASGCLTPYRYLLHEVTLTAEELDKWRELTEQLGRAGFRMDDDGQTLVPNERAERLLRERRAVLEHAEGKMGVLRDLLLEWGPRNVARCLIYASAKPPVLSDGRQIELVNALLSNLGVVSHQFTSAETSKAGGTRLLERFANGDYQVLTAMKVLDEGVDIPQTDTAFLLASSTVKREWVQRRGRILRAAPGKREAVLHDFLVLPPEQDSDHGRSILRSELRRAEEFARLAVNEWDDGGPREVMARHEQAAWT